MNDKRVGRRDVLLGAGAGAAGALAVLGGVANPAIAKADDSDGAGAYLLGIHPKGAPAFRGVVGFAAGGVFVGSDANSPGDNYIGSWQRTGGSSFKGRFVQWQFDSSGTFEGFSFIEVTGSFSGDNISGAFTVRFFTPAGGSSTTVAGGTFRGEKLQA